MFKIKDVEGAAAEAARLNLEKFYIDNYNNPLHQMAMAVDCALVGLSQTIVQAGEAQRSFRSLLDGAYQQHRRRCEEDILEGRGARATAAKLNGTYAAFEYVGTKYVVDDRMKAGNIDELMKVLNPNGSEDPVWAEVRNAIQYSYQGTEKVVSPNRLYNYLFRTSDISHGTAPMSRCGEPPSVEVIRPNGIYDLIEKDLPSGLYELASNGYGRVPKATPFYVKPKNGGIFNTTALLIGEGADNDLVIMVRCQREGVWVRAYDYSFFDHEYVVSEMVNYFVENFEVNPVVSDLKRFVDNAFDSYVARVAELSVDDPIQIEAILRMYDDEDGVIKGHMNRISCTDHYDLRRYISSNCLASRLLVKPHPEPTAPQDPPIAGYSLKVGSILAVLDGSYLKFDKVPAFQGDEILYSVTIGHNQITGKGHTQSSWVSIPYHIRHDILKKYMSMVAEFRKRH